MISLLPTHSFVSVKLWLILQESASGSAPLGNLPWSKLPPMSLLPLGVGALPLGCHYTFCPLSQHHVLHNNLGLSLPHANHCPYLQFHLLGIVPALRYTHLLKEWQTEIGLGENSVESTALYGLQWVLEGKAKCWPSPGSYAHQNHVPRLTNLWNKKTIGNILGHFQMK